MITRRPAELVRIARGVYLSVDVAEPYRVFLELAEIVEVLGAASSERARSYPRAARLRLGARRSKCRVPR